jgi:hypothetical protein
MKTDLQIDTDEDEDGWGIEFDEDELRNCPFDALRENIDGRLCDAAEIVPDGEGGFRLQWCERHPEMLPYDEMFPTDDSGEAKRTDARLAKYNDLRSRLQARCFELEISRRQAFAILAYFWLPEEFAEERNSLL